MVKSHYKILLEELREEVKNLRKKVTNKKLLNEDADGIISNPEFQWIQASSLGKGGGIYGLGDSGVNGQFAVIDSPSAIKNAIANVKSGIPATVNGQNNLGAGMGFAANDSDWQALIQKMNSAGMLDDSQTDEPDVVVRWQNINNYYGQERDSELKNNLQKYSLYEPNQQQGYPAPLNAYDQYQLYLDRMPLGMRTKIQNDIEALSGRASKGNEVTEKIGKMQAYSPSYVSMWANSPRKGLR
jgi:hypothetical protein